MSESDGVGAFGKAAENLTSVLKDSLGLIIEPRKMRAIAKTEMDIEKQKLTHKYDLIKQDLAERANLRMYHTELRRQYNLEQIGQEATILLPENASPNEISIDWLNHFASCAQDVGEEELRKLWASILTKEAIEPGKYSKRTLDYLKSFDINDCKLFKKITQFIFLDEESGLGIIVVPSKDLRQFKDKYDFSILEVMHLRSIGIISDAENTVLRVKSNDNTQLRYFNSRISFMNIKENELIFGDLLILTQVGSQLASIVGLEYNEEYLNDIIDKTKVEGFEIEVTNLIK